MSWREKLEEIRQRMFGRHRISGTVALAPPKKDASVHRQEAIDLPRRVLAINLGIDFGTSFTKVCYRDIGTEESVVAAIGDELRQTLLPSIVLISREGFLSLDIEGKKQQDSVAVDYLKMRLAGSPIATRTPPSEDLNLNDQTVVKALAAWFLAAVIVRTQNWIDLNEEERLKNRDLVWSANVGVPVEHYDSEALVTFEEVLGVAWLWVKDGGIPDTVQNASDLYLTTCNRLRSEVSDFHAVPEIAAAVQSFVMSREATPGIYIYFDIGGGTTDGVAFNFLNDAGERQINFYSGKVEPLGISAIGEALQGHAHTHIDINILERLLDCSPKSVRDEYALRIRQLVGFVIMTAKRKDGRNWRVDAFQDSEFRRKYIGQLSRERMKPLIVFLGGGGSISEWYRSTIGSTHEEFKHFNAGIPPYKILSVPTPKDLRVPEGNDFTRFAISYGLSIPFGEGPDIRLPSQFADAEKPRQWEPSVVSYSDSKDVFD